MIYFSCHCWFWCVWAVRTRPGRGVCLKTAYWLRVTSELLWGIRTWELPRKCLLLASVVSDTVRRCPWEQAEAVHPGLRCCVEVIVLLKLPPTPEENRLQRGNYSSREELEVLFTFPSSGKLTYFWPIHFLKSNILRFVWGFFTENICYFQNHLVKKKKVVWAPENTLVWNFRLIVIICVFLQECCVSCTLTFPCFFQNWRSHIICIHNKNKALLYHIFLRL